MTKSIIFITLTLLTALIQGQVQNQEVTDFENQLIHYNIISYLNDNIVEYKNVIDQWDFFKPDTSSKIIKEKLLKSDSICSKILENDLSFIVQNNHDHLKSLIDTQNELRKRIKLDSLNKKHILKTLNQSFLTRSLLTDSNEIKVFNSVIKFQIIFQHIKSANKVLSVYNISRANCKDLLSQTNIKIDQISDLKTKSNFILSTINHLKLDYICGLIKSIKDKTLMRGSKESEVNILLKLEQNKNTLSILTYSNSPNSFLTEFKKAHEKFFENSQYIQTNQAFHVLDEKNFKNYTYHILNQALNQQQASIYKTNLIICTILYMIEDCEYSIAIQKTIVGSFNFSIKNSG